MGVGPYTLRGYTGWSAGETLSAREREADPGTLTEDPPVVEGERWFRLRSEGHPLEVRVQPEPPRDDLRSAAIAAPEEMRAVLLRTVTVVEVADGAEEYWDDAYEEAMNPVLLLIESLMDDQSVQEDPEGDHFSTSSGFVPQEPTASELTELDDHRRRRAELEAELRASAPPTAGRNAETRPAPPWVRRSAASVRLLLAVLNGGLAVLVTFFVAGATLLLLGSESLDPPTLLAIWLVSSTLVSAAVLLLARRLAKRAARRGSAGGA